MNSYDSIINKLILYAKESELIQAMVLFGSRAREKNAADQYSDYDIIFIVKDVECFLNTDEWLKQIEKYYISFEEPTAAEGQERRVFFSDAMDMDFLFYDVKNVEKLAADPTIQSFFSRGYRMLVDKVDFECKIERNKSTEQMEDQNIVLTEKEYINLVNTFWFHSIWSVKKILRGEIWSAKSCVDGYMKNLFRQLLESYTIAVSGKDFDVWHDGRFFDQWVEDNIKKQLRSAYGTYDSEDILRALNNTMLIFSDLVRNTSALLSYDNPIAAEAYAFEQIEKLTSGSIKSNYTK